MGIERGAIGGEYGAVGGMNHRAALDDNGAVADAEDFLGVTDRAIIVERGAIGGEYGAVGGMNHRAALETHLGVTDQGPRRGGRAKG